MKVLILAAGYATRLHPLTLTRAKPLLPVAGKPMIDYVLDNLAPMGGIDRVYIVTNAKFAEQFQKWADDYRATKSKLDFTIVNDGSTDDTNKLGAIGDLHLVIQREKIEDDLIVVAGDNLFSEKLTAFGDYCRQKQEPVLAVYDVGSLEDIKKYNSINVPFLVSVFLLAVSVWIRLSMNESPAFAKMKAEGKTSKAPLTESFGQWKNLKSLFWP